MSKSKAIFWPRARRLAWALAALVASGAATAGGHLDVDDSATLDPGQCQYEAWVGRTGIEPIKVWHLGPACRIGPFEVGINIDRLAVKGRETDLVLGPQLKWMFWGDAESIWSAALSATASFEVRNRHGRPGGQFLVPLTWHPDPKLWVHANYGADWAFGSGVRTVRGGLGVEWAFHEKVSLIAERFKSFNAWNTRAGLRYALTPLITIDLTASRTGEGTQRTHGFILGINHEFGRP